MKNLNLNIFSMIYNYYYLITGIVCILSAFTHALNGQKTALSMINQGGIDLTTKTTIFYVWHIITAENIIFGSALAIMSISNDLSKVKFAAFLIAIILIARLVVIVGSTLLKNRKGLAETLTDSIAIIVLVGLIIVGTL